MRGLTNKVVLVAGGATGIGAAVARRMAEHGAVAAVGDIDLARAEATAAEIRAAGGAASAHQFDCGDQASVEAIVADVAGQHGRLDFLHANAADISDRTYGQDLDIVDVDLAVWQRTLDITLNGYFHLVRNGIPHLQRAGGGAIVLTSSEAVFVGDPRHVAYGVAKAGVTALTRHVAAAYGKQGIRCNSVAPGLVISEIAAEIARLHPERAERHQRILDASPTPRLGTSDDLASVVAFLFSEDAAYVNGQTWSVNGGSFMR